MRRLIRVDLPAPVGPTMATLLPAGISMDKFLIKIFQDGSQRNMFKGNGSLTWSLVKTSYLFPATSGLSKTKHRHALRKREHFATQPKQKKYH